LAIIHPENYHTARKSFCGVHITLVFLNLFDNYISSVHSNT